MAYKSWAFVPDNIKTKTGWSKEGKRIKKGEVGHFDKVYTYDKWRTFEFFTENQVEDKRKVNRKPKPPLEMTVENLATSLYLINKSAKVSRDSKSRFYFSNQHSKTKSAKTRQLNLYQLKDEVLEMTLLDEYAFVKGYHKIDNAYFHLISFGGLTFHRPTTVDKIEGLAYLGDIENPISSEVKSEIKKGITLAQAKELLKRYIGE